MTAITQSYRGIGIHSLSELRLYRLVDQQDDGLRELPDEYEFRNLEPRPRRRFTTLRRKLREMIAKTRGERRAAKAKRK